MAGDQINQDNITLNLGEGGPNVGTRCGYMEAVNLLCEEMEIEPELVAKYLSQPIIEKIKVEAQKVNLLPREPQLFSDET